MLLTPSLNIPFAELTPQVLTDSVEAMLAKTESDLAALANSSEPATFANVMKRLDTLGLELEFTFGVMRHLESVNTTPELRSAFNALLPKVTDFHSKIYLNEKLWERVKSFLDSAEAKALPPTIARYCLRTKENFLRQGAALPPEKKKRLAEINSRLAEISSKFSQNVLDATNSFEHLMSSEEELVGLPESAKNMGLALAKQRGLSGWRFTLHAPSFIAIMTYLDDRAVREKFFRAFTAIGTQEPFVNIELAHEMLALRNELATLLGYKDFSDYTTADRMAKSGQKAQDFVDQMRQNLKPHFERETKELLQFAESKLGLSQKDIRPWDVAYVDEKLKISTLDFDDEALRPYFAVDAVMTGMFTIAEKLFGISIAKRTGLPTWHESVEVYEVKDLSGEVLGIFHSDLYPRESKHGGAWMNAFITHIEDSDPPHFGLMCANFTPPSPGKPALLTHDEVTTLFHEFGHLLHHLLTKVPLHGQAMGGVAWDFIELPSQILENWCWERGALDLFARHIETKEPIPEELFQKLRTYRVFREASVMMRQVGFATLDLKLHREYKRADYPDLLSYTKQILSQHSPLPLLDGDGRAMSFTHIFGSPIGYAAGYYSYQWAAVLDSDAFTRFLSEGILNASTGKALRYDILSRGDSDAPDVLYRNFMGRDPDSKAILKRAGLVT